MANSAFGSTNRVSYELVATPDELVSGYLNPFNKVNKLLDKNKVQNILKKYGIYQNINNLDLYQDSMVHESYTINKIKEICSRDNVKVVKLSLIHISEPTRPY